MKSALLMVRYSWRYLAVALVAFIVGWHTYSVVSQVNRVQHEVTMAASQLAPQINAAVNARNLIGLRNVVGNMFVTGTRYIRFDGQASGLLGATAQIFIGNRAVRRLGVIEKSAPVIFNGALLGEVQYQMDLIDVSGQVFRGNRVLYILMVAFMLVIALFANVGSLATLWRVEQGLKEYSAAARSSTVADLRKFLDREGEKGQSDPITTSLIRLFVPSHLLGPLFRVVNPT